jgi:hypothetical protein
MKKSFVGLLTMICLVVCGMAFSSCSSDDNDSSSVPHFSAGVTFGENTSYAAFGDEGFAFIASVKNKINNISSKSTSYVSQKEAQNVYNELVSEMTEYFDSLNAIEKGKYTVDINIDYVVYLKDATKSGYVKSQTFSFTYNGIE